MKIYIFVTAVLIFFQQAISAQKKLEPFKSGDCVVLAGNSITEAGLYGSYIWLYYMTHFPERKIQVLNAGVGGDAARNIYDRLDGDILAKKPTVLALTFGMNDSKYFEYNSPNPNVDQFVKDSYDSYVKIESRLQQLKNVKKIIMSSSPYDETVQVNGNYFKGKTITMEKIIEFQKTSAIKNDWSYVDFFYPMTKINLHEQKTDPSYTCTGPDRIHPGSAGHFIMAYLFLKTQGLAHSPVSDVLIDFQKGQLLKAENAKVQNLNKSGKGIQFQYLANSLPFPYDTVPRVWQNPQVQSEALKVIPFDKEFNTEKLTIKGLAKGDYMLKIDGIQIKKVSAGELSDGVNLALLHNTPQYKQALKVLSLNNQRKEIEGKYRNYFWVQYNFLKEKGLLFNKQQSVMDTIAKYAPTNGWLNAKKDDFQLINTESTRVATEKRIKDLVDEIYNINKPELHVISVVFEK